MEENFPTLVQHEIDVKVEEDVIISFGIKLLGEPY